MHFLDSKEMDTISFPASLSGHERKIIHEVHILTIICTCALIYGLYDEFFLWDMHIIICRCAQRPHT